MTRINPSTDGCQRINPNQILSWHHNKIELVMGNIKLKGDWNVVKGKLKQQFGNLTDNDLLFIKGKEEELIGRIQQKIGKTKQEIINLLAKL